MKINPLRVTPIVRIQKDKKQKEEKKKRSD